MPHLPARPFLFVGVPLVQTMYGSNGIPYLLVYFFANCVFIWTVGIFNIQLDGARRGMTEEPKIFSVRGLKMLLSPPLMGFLIGLIVVLLSIPVPKSIAQSTHTIGQLATPLALVFVGITVWQIGFEKLRKRPKGSLADSSLLLRHSSDYDVFVHDAFGHGSAHAEVFHLGFRASCLFRDCRAL